MKRSIAFGSAASWCSRLVGILLNIILLPVLLKKLDQEEVGIWILIAQTAAVLSFLDLGFTSALTRAMAFAHGASSGRSSPREGRTSEMATILRTGQILFRCVALVALIISISAGIFYLYTLKLHTTPWSVAALAWIMMSAASALLLAITPATSLIIATGYMGWDAVITAASTVFSLGLQIIIVFSGGGILGLASVSALAAVLQRAAFIWFVRWKFGSDNTGKSGRFDLRLLKEWRPLALRAWLTGIGTLLMYNTDQFFVSSSLGAFDLPSYRAAYLALLNLHSCAGILSLASAPFVAHAWVRGEIEVVRALMRRSATFGVLTFAAGAGFILGSGNALFTAWLGAGHFVGNTVLLILAANFLLEQQDFVTTTSSRATGDEAFTASSLIGGGLKIGLALILNSRIRSNGTWSIDVNSR